MGGPPLTGRLLLISACCRRRTAGAFSCCLFAPQNATQRRFVFGKEALELLLPLTPRHATVNVGRFSRVGKQLINAIGPPLGRVLQLPLRHLKGGVQCDCPSPWLCDALAILGGTQTHDEAVPTKKGGGSWITLTPSSATSTRSPPLRRESSGCESAAATAESMFFSSRKKGAFACETPTTFHPRQPFIRRQSP